MDIGNMKHMNSIEDMEEDIKNIEEMLEFKIDIIKYHAWVGTKVINSVENLLTRYKQLDSLIGEIDNKEVNDALHMLLHWALKNTEYETQKQQFQIVNAYIKQLEEENKNKINELQTKLNEKQEKIQII